MKWTHLKTSILTKISTTNLNEAKRRTKILRLSYNPLKLNWEIFCYLDEVDTLDDVDIDDDVDTELEVDTLRGKRKQ